MICVTTYKHAATHISGYVYQFHFRKSHSESNNSQNSIGELFDGGGWRMHEAS